jgi:hypothetical protein
LKNANASPWTYSSNVLAPGNPTYNGLDVIRASASLNAFATYMNNLTLPFDYDIAIGLTESVAYI